MDKFHYEEMSESIAAIEKDNILNGKVIYTFGHCNATEELIDLLKEHGYQVFAIMDNNVSKQGTYYNDIPIIPPDVILREKIPTIVLIVARAYEAMAAQLRNLGYKGEIKKLVEYNSFSEYSLSADTIKRKYERVQRGMSMLEKLKNKYQYCFRFLCPFSALGDVFYAMSYLPYFLEKRNIKKYVVCVVGKGCYDVVKMFGHKSVENLAQNNMDEIIQAELYTNDNQSFILHHDRPYVINLNKALYTKMIPLEVMCRSGIYGLPQDTIPCKPTHLQVYPKLDELKKGKSLIVSPYAKSVTNIPMSYWECVIAEYKQKGYDIFTSAVGTEKTLQGTKRIEVPLAEMQSVVEYAGAFIGLRSGLCDVIKYANCNKTALYPDRCYSDTKWKMKEIYYLDGWDNIVIEQE